LPEQEFYLHDLGGRIRAARAYAGNMSQDDLAAQIGMSVSWLKTVESGKQIQEIQAAGLIASVAKACDLPVAWFSADWSQLDPGYVPPQDQLDELQATVVGVAEKLGELTSAGAMMQEESRVALDEFLKTQTTDGLMERVRPLLEPLIQRLEKITETVEANHEVVAEIAERLPEESS
jgi:transcriptional regulator with XRE-family HTH domain